MIKGGDFGPDSLDHFELQEGFVSDPVTNRIETKTGGAFGYFKGALDVIRENPGMAIASAGALVLVGNELRKKLSSKKSEK